MSKQDLAVTLADVQSAQRLIADQIVHTPVLHSKTLSAITGAEIWLKMENHQFTASFKERGALVRLLALSDDQRERGVICSSAGNHAQAVAYHAKRLGIPATIVMPRFTPNAKVAQTRYFGPEVILHGNVFDEARDHARQLAAERGLTMIHPFDDAAVISGQGTLALEYLEDAPQPDVMVVPIGGGGLISGVATVMKALAPSTEIIGVEAERFASTYRALWGEGPEFGASTIAEGIAVKSPGELTLPIIRERVDDVLLASEASLERAVLLLLEVEKTVAEGAGAAGLAAVLQYPDRFRGRRVGLVLCGGNIDTFILSSVIQRGLVRSARLVCIRVEIPDVPGALGHITSLLGELDSNIVEIDHRRAFSASSVRATEVELVLQMRGEEQVSSVLDRLQAEGYAARRID